MKYLDRPAVRARTKRRTRRKVADRCYNDDRIEGRGKQDIIRYQLE